MKPVAILGPTAAGKTAVAAALAQRVGGQVISFDSRQVYRGVTISSNAPSPSDLGGVPLHLVGRLDPHEAVTAAGYVAMARAAAAAIPSGHPHVLTAGTGMYLKAYLEDLDLGGMGAVPGLRAQLEDEARRDLPGLARRLQDLAPDLTALTDLQNPARVVRRMELLWAAAMAQDASPARQPMPISSLKVGLRVATATLDQRIDQRLEGMIAGGWHKEVEMLLDRTPPPSAQVLKSIGVAEMAAHLTGALGESAMRDRVRLRTRQYAKRQRTWFRADPEVHWVEAGTRPVSDIVEEILEMLN